MVLEKHYPNQSKNIMKIFMNFSDVTERKKELEESYPGQSNNIMRLVFQFSHGKTQWG